MSDFEYESARARLDPGDCLVVFTDGVNEAMSAEGVLLGRDALRELLASLDRRASAEDMGRAVLRRVLHFEVGSKPTDDLTVFVLRRNC